MRLDNANESKKNRKRNRLIFRLIVLTVLVAAVAYALIMNAKKGNTIYGIGDQAPDFQLQQVNKNNELETIQLSDLEGKGVMLNFWATWCKPCEAEMPYMEELYPKYRDNGIEIVAVSLDSTEPVIHQFIEKYNLTFPILYDNRKKVNDLYKIGAIPSTYFKVFRSLNLWATWCKPCEAEMPYMEELYPKYRDNGIEIVAVSLDSTEPVIHQFIEKYNLTFPILYDNRKEVNDLYKIGPIPSTYF